VAARFLGILRVSSMRQLRIAVEIAVGNSDLDINLLHRTLLVLSAQQDCNSERVPKGAVGFK
jgi:hypothetical protein